jgi:hypothetical protein
MFVCEAVTQLRLLYIYLSRGRCPAAALYAAVLSFNTIDQTYRIGWSSGNAVDLYSGDAEFKSRLW